MKNLTLFIIFLQLFTFSFCNLKNEKITIGVLFDSFTAPRFQKEKIYFEEKINELGGIAIIKTAEGSELKQEEQAKELINEGVDAIIIIASNVNTAASIVRYANDHDVKVIAYDRLIRNCNLDYFVTFDGEKIGELLAEYALKNIPKGNYVLFNGDRVDDNAKELYEGTIKKLQPSIDNGNINIIYTEFVENWSGENAAFTTKKIIELSGERIDVIISQYDGMTDGIVRTLENKNVKNVLLTGQDAEIAACNRILNGKQAMTIYKPVIIMANKCVEITFDLLKNGKTVTSNTIYNGKSYIPTRLFTPIAVDKNNLHQTVIADGYLSVEEINAYLAKNE